MKLHCVVITALITVGTTSAGAVIAPVNPATLVDVRQPVEQVACKGFRYNYRSFNSCMKANKFNAKHCNKICS
jgi:hypothetical protein